MSFEDQEAGSSGKMQTGLVGALAEDSGERPHRFPRPPLRHRLQIWILEIQESISVHQSPVMMINSRHLLCTPEFLLCTQYSS